MTHLQNNLGIFKVKKPVYFWFYGHFPRGTRFIDSNHGHDGGGVQDGAA
jgi:hypothetical protein